MNFNDLLQVMCEKKGSDLFITADLEPLMKVNGQLAPLARTKMSAELIRQLIHSIMNEQQRAEFKETKECNFAITSGADGRRFRVSAFYQRDMPGMVIRRIENVIPLTDELKLPPVLKKLIMEKRGIILFVGGTGTGKSTSLASLIGHRNRSSHGHIITIEDPVEFIHQHAGCIITQREVGIDTQSFEVALKNTLRQAPDVILIGEIRTTEVMNYALNFAETGHLVLATMHANNANQAIDRIVNFFDSERHHQIQMDLSLNLKAIVAQQLIPTIDKKSRRAAIEILINSPLIAEYIRKGQINQIKEIMTKSRELGMQTFDMSLLDLYHEGAISYEDALKHADAPNDLRLKIKLSGDAQPETASHTLLSIHE